MRARRKVGLKEGISDEKRKEDEGMKRKEEKQKRMRVLVATCGTAVCP